MPTQTLEMVDSVAIPVDSRLATLSRAAWGAILVGAVLAMAVVAALTVLGIAVGATSVDMADRDTPGPASFTVGAGVWMLLSHLAGLFAGGYAAGRLLRRADQAEAGVHGLGVWAVAFLISATFLGSVAIGTANGAVSSAFQALGSATQGVVSAAGNAASELDREALIERARSSLTAPADPAAMNREQRVADAGAIIG